MVIVCLPAGSVSTSFTLCFKRGVDSCDTVWKTNFALSCFRHVWWPSRFVQKCANPSFNLSLFEANHHDTSVEFGEGTPFFDKTICCLNLLSMKNFSACEELQEDAIYNPKFWSLPYLSHSQRNPLQNRPPAFQAPFLLNIR